MDFLKNNDGTKECVSADHYLLEMKSTATTGMHRICRRLLIPVSPFKTEVRKWIVGTPY